jgi:aminoglycoside N3'-acetyltransferase
VALGLTHGGDRRPARHRRVEPGGEIAERVIAEACRETSSARRAREPHQRFNARKGRAAEQHSHDQTPEQSGGGNAPRGAAIARTL